MKNQTHSLVILIHGVESRPKFFQFFGIDTPQSEDSAPHPSTAMPAVHFRPCSRWMRAPRSHMGEQQRPHRTSSQGFSWRGTSLPTNIKHFRCLTFLLQNNNKQPIKWSATNVVVRGLPHAARWLRRTNTTWVSFLLSVKKGETHGKTILIEW